MNEKTSDSQENQQNKSESKPNDVGGFYFSSHLKISDPNSKEILVQKRGDS
jgi:hypothetical protein